MKHDFNFSNLSGWWRIVDSEFRGSPSDLPYTHIFFGINSYLYYDQTFPRIEYHLIISPEHYSDAAVLSDVELSGPVPNPPKGCFVRFQLKGRFLHIFESFTQEFLKSFDKEECATTKLVRDKKFSPAWKHIPEKEDLDLGRCGLLKYNSRSSFHEGTIDLLGRKVHLACFELSRNEVMEMIVKIKEIPEKLAELISRERSAGTHSEVTEIESLFIYRECVKIYCDAKNPRDDHQACFVLAPDLQLLAVKLV